MVIITYCAGAATGASRGATARPAPTGERPPRPDAKPYSRTFMLVKS